MSDQGERYEGSWFQRQNLPQYRDWEYSWLEEAKKYGWEMPAIREQGQNPTCILHAVSYGIELEIALLAWLCKTKVNLPRFNIDSFLLEYQIEAQRTLGPQPPGFYRVKVALRVFEKLGVLATGGEAVSERIHIAGSRSYSYLSFEQACQVIYDGHGLVGAFPVTNDLIALGPNAIYEVSRNGISPDQWANFGAHCVCFVGYGMRGGRAYLVYANSWGEGFSEMGVGRVYFDQIYQLNDGEYCLHSVQVKGGAAPVVPPRRGNPSTWRMYRDPRYPLFCDGGNIRVVHPKTGCSAPSTSASTYSSSSGSTGAFRVRPLDSALHASPSSELPNSLPLCPSGPRSNAPASASRSGGRDRLPAVSPSANACMHMWRRKEASAAADVPSSEPAASLATPPRQALEEAASDVCSVCVSEIDAPMIQLQAILPPGSIPNAYANGSNDEQAFIQNLVLFFTAFFKDMACDTFLKIVQKCKRKFVTQQVGENEPFVSELLTNLAMTIHDLEPHQIHTFYESVGHMIQAESDNTKRDEYLKRLMSRPKQKWAEIIGQAGQSIDILKNQDVIRSVLNILQTNTSVATALGPHFFPQISLIFLDMLTVYRMYSELVSSTIAEGGPYASKSSFVKLLRSIERETLKLIETFVDKAEDLPHLGKQFVPPMMDPVLGDYARNVPDARKSEVLSMFVTIINKYKAEMLDDVPRIFEAVFQSTLEMITKNFEDYPEHRLKFFSLLRAIGTHCFKALIQLSSQQLKLVIDSINWAFRHTERNIAETGLSLLLEILKNFQASAFQNQFYKTYFLNIEQEIFAVLTDSFHKPGFKLHVLVLQHLFCVIDGLTEPLWDASSAPYQSNAMYVREYTINLLGSSFPNIAVAELTKFVDGLLSLRHDLTTFKNHIIDFLVQSKKFSVQDNKDMYAEEAAVQREEERQRMMSIPGFIAPSELQDEMVDS